MRYETRMLPVSNFRAVDGKLGRLSATVLRYDVIDEYDTEFAPEVFLESLAKRMPRIVWAHDWADPVGRWLEFENVRDDGGARLDLIGQLDDFEAVPRARQAWSQLESGTIDQFSVGFRVFDLERVMRDGRDIIRFTRGALDEASLVIVGAVPGTQLLSMRHGRFASRGSIPREAAAQILVALSNGDTDLTDALQSLKALDDTPSAPPGTPTVPEGSETITEPEPEVDPEAEPVPEPTPTEPLPTPQPEPNPEPPTAPTLPSPEDWVMADAEADEALMLVASLLQ